MLIPAYYDAPDHLEGSVPMRGDDPRHDGMFSYITPEARVRPDHPLRPIRRMTDAALARLSPRFDRLYSTTGRPSIPPGEAAARAAAADALQHPERAAPDGGARLQHSVSVVRRAESRRCRVGRDDVYEESRPAARRRRRRRVLRGSAGRDQGRRPALRRALHGRRHPARSVGESQELQTEGRRRAGRPTIRRIRP